MILDEGERAKFCAYARVQVETADAILAQLQKLPAFPQVLRVRELARRTAYQAVLDDLKSIECQSVLSSLPQQSS